MEEILKKFKSYFITFLISFILGLGCMYWYIHTSMKPSDNPSQIITTTTNSGTPIQHDNWNFSGDSIVFDSASGGEGTSTTEIPKTLIPEYNWWYNKNHCIQASYQLLYNNGEFNSTYGIAYLRRFGIFAAGGGVIASKKYCGIQCIGQVWF